MAVFIQAIGAIFGALGGLMLGTMVKFNFSGEPVDLRYLFLLVGVLVGYFISRLVTRTSGQKEAG